MVAEEEPWRLAVAAQLVLSCHRHAGRDCEGLSSRRDGRAGKMHDSTHGKMARPIPLARIPLWLKEAPFGTVTPCCLRSVPARLEDRPATMTQRSLAGAA